MNLNPVRIIRLLVGRLNFLTAFEASNRLRLAAVRTCRVVYPSRRMRFFLQGGRNGQKV